MCGHDPMDNNIRVQREPIIELKLETHHLHADDGIPNNRLPLIVYRGALSGDALSPDGCSELFQRNGWQRTWLNGVFPYWHYHPLAHEVLGCVAGKAHVGFGGDNGIATDFNAGDVVLIPAGVGHKRLSQEPGFLVVGGYPPGQSSAICNADDMDIDAAIEKASAVPIPASDPLTGESGGLHEVWR
jgi:uncharacterized protein YjlB